MRSQNVGCRRVFRPTSWLEEWMSDRLLTRSADDGVADIEQDACDAFLIPG